MFRGDLSRMRQIQPRRFRAGMEILKSSSRQILRFSNRQILKSSNPQIRFSNPQILKFSNFQMPSGIWVLADPYDAARHDRLDVEGAGASDQRVALGARIQPHLADPLLRDLVD